MPTLTTLRSTGFADPQIPPTSARKCPSVSMRLRLGWHPIGCSWITPRLKFCGAHLLVDNIRSRLVRSALPHPTERSTKLKILHRYFDQCLYPIKTSSSVKNVLCKRFSTYCFTHIHLMRCLSSMAKSHCCNNNFTGVQITSLLAKNIEEEYKLFLCC